MKSKSNNDWPEKRLGNKDISMIKYGKANPKKEGSIPVIGSSGIYDHTQVPLIDPPTILVGRKGNAGSIKFIREPCWPSDTTFFIKLLTDEIDYAFLSEYLTYRKISNQKTQTTLPSLTIEDLKSVKIPVPPLVEQRGIVEVLGTVDECIRLTDAVIERAEELKRGLMQQLLTRGIGHTEYKETPLGEIPKTWKIKQIRDVSYVNRINVNPDKTPEKIIKYIDIASIKNFEILNYTEYIGKKAPSRARRVVLLDDVIVSTVRPYLRAFAKITKEYDGYVCSTGFTVLTPQKNIHPEFLFQYIKTEIFVNILRRRMVGSSYPAVTQKDVEIVNIPLPPLNEQEKIANILSTIDNDLKKNYIKKEKFIVLKNGLLQILLSGKTRVELKADELHRIGDSREANN